MHVGSSSSTKVNKRVWQATVNSLSRALSARSLLSIVVVVLQLKLTFRFDGPLGPLAAARAYDPNIPCGIPPEHAYCYPRLAIRVQPPQSRSTKIVRSSFMSRLQLLVNVRM